MNLVIDIGNTRTKVAVFNKQQLVHKQVFEKLTVVQLKKTIKQFPAIQAAILSAVVKTDKALVNFLDTHFQLVFLTHECLLPFINKYASPQTLGNDRLAVSAAAAYLYSKENVLVINCGSCITFDFINSKHEYLGGSISAGLLMQLKALHSFTGKLPLITLKNIEKTIGITTEESILTGVINGTVEAIKGTINNYAAKYKNLIVVLTGGDAEFLKPHLKNNKIFAHPDLTLIGLNQLLNYNHSTS
jgi:type III pantothenate kinase